MKLTDKCPECGSQLYFNKGYADTWYEPGIPDSIDCHECGWCETDEARISRVAEEMWRLREDENSQRT